MSTLLQAVRQLEGRLANALAAQQERERRARRGSMSIFRNRERRAVRHAWLSLRATMYVAVERPPIGDMEKRQSEAEAARISRRAQRRVSTSSRWMLRTRRAQPLAEQREHCRGRAGPARRRRRGTRTARRGCQKGGGAREGVGGGAGRAEAANDAAEDATAIAIERAERIHELERSLAEAVALQVARAELEELLARSATPRCGIRRSGRDHDDARRDLGAKGRYAVRPTTTSFRNCWPPPRPALRHGKAADDAPKMVSSARRSGASCCFMVLRRWRRARVAKAWRSWKNATAAPPRRARAASDL